MNTALKVSLWRCHKDLKERSRRGSVWEWWVVVTSIYGTLKLIEWVATFNVAEVLGYFGL
jgi:hypothetical protein